MTVLPRKTLRKWVAALTRCALHGGMWLGVWLMGAASASYLELSEAHPFFLEKLPLAHPKLYLAALYTHVPSALIALPACLLLSLAWVRARFPALHRWLGRVTAALVLCGVVPSGMYLACFAQGGLLTTFGFWLTGLIAFISMLGSIRSARRKDMRRHRRFSAHVLAQLSVAVISRVLLVGAEELGCYDGWVYTAALFVPVLGALFVTEWWTGRWHLPPTPKGVRHEAVAAVSRLDAVR